MKFLVEIEVQGPLAIELRRADTVGACQMIERVIRRGFQAYRWIHHDTFLTVRAMEHVTLPPVRVP